MNDIDRALDHILAHEGGWSNVPQDRGGRTSFGITEGTFRQAKRTIPQLPNDVSEITQDHARRIYEKLYWYPSGCGHLPWPANYAVMDAAVQHGQHRARKWMQRGLGVDADGVIGPQTLAAISRVRGWWRPTSRMLLYRAKLYIRILATSSQSVFARGWANRLEAVIRVCDEDTPEEEPG